MDQNQIFIIFKILYQAYPKENISSDTIELYRLLLSDCNFDDVKQSVLMHIRTQKFFPTIAEIREGVANLGVGELLNPEKAWSTVSEAIRRHGRSERPMFECEAIERTVKRMGWSALCESENPNLERSYFIKLYAQEIRRMKQDILRGDGQEALTERVGYFLETDRRTLQ